MRLVLVSHAQTDWTKQGLFQGHSRQQLAGIDPSAAPSDEAEPRGSCQCLAAQRLMPILSCSRTPDTGVRRSRPWPQGHALAQARVRPPVRRPRRRWAHA